MAAVELITKDNIKTHLDIASAITTFDAELTVIAKGVSQFVRKYTGRNFNTAAQSNIVEYHDGSENGERKRNIIAENFPITSIGSISYNSSADFESPSWVAFDPTEYDADLSRGIIDFRSGTPEGFQNIRLVYTFGTATFSEDYPDLFLACLKLAGKWFEKRKAEGISQESIAGASVQWVSDMDKDTRQILDLYKNIYV